MDAPCSSERHLLSKNQEMLSWTPRRTKNCALRQRALLQAALFAVREGGLVVYSTCSISRAENDGVISKVCWESQSPLWRNTERKHLF